MALLHRITIDLDDSQYTKLSNLAKDDDRTVSSQLRRIIKTALDQPIPMKDVHDGATTLREWNDGPSA